MAARSPLPASVSARSLVFRDRMTKTVGAPNAAIVLG